MTTLDLLIVLFVLLTVLRGARTGLLAGVFSLVGVVVGASLGSRVAPYLMPEGENPLFGAGITLVSILAFAALGEIAARAAGGALRNRLSSPASETLDGLGGATLGLVLSLVLVWAIGLFALQAPPLAGVHPAVKGSRILQLLNERMPAELLTRAVAELNPLPQIRGPEADVAVPNSRLARDPEVLAAGPRTVRVTSIACGYGVEGSGWVAAPNLVVTNAHVVASTGRGNPLRRQKRRGDPARERPRSRPHAARHPQRGRGDRRARLPGERPARHPASPHWLDAARDLRRRLQPGPGGAHRHQLPRLRPARQLGRPSCQRGRRGRRHRLRQPRRLEQLGLRHPLPTGRATPGRSRRTHRSREYRRVCELACQHAARLLSISARYALSARSGWRLRFQLVSRVSTHIPQVVGIS